MNDIITLPPHYRVPDDTPQELAESIATVFAAQQGVTVAEYKAERAAREKRKARLIARANWELAEKRFARWMPKPISP